MNPQITKWLAYCEGKSQSSKADFIGLLSTKWGEEDLCKILQYVPMKVNIIHNLMRVYENTQDQPHVYLRPKKENAASPGELKRIAESFLDSQRRFLLTRRIDEETRRWLEQSDLETVYVTIERLRSSVTPGNDIRSYIIDEEANLLSYRQDTGLHITTSDSTDYRVMSGIKEALFGLASDYYLAWFVLSPILNTDVDYSVYFDFWKKGGEYALTERQLLVSSIWRISGT